MVGSKVPYSSQWLLLYSWYWGQIWTQRRVSFLGLRSGVKPKAPRFFRRQKRRPSVGIDWFDPMLRRRTGRGEGLWTGKRADPVALSGPDKGSLVEWATSALGYPRGPRDPEGKSFQKEALFLGAAPRAKRNPYPVSPIISGRCWPQRNKWQRLLAWRSHLSYLGEKERESERQTIAVGYLVNPIWPPLGGLSRSCDRDSPCSVEG
jgi:hypothetical protein